MDLERIQQLLDRAQTKRVLIIGDLMLDEFVWGKVGRISPATVTLQELIASVQDDPK